MCRFILLIGLWAGWVSAAQVTNVQDLVAAVQHGKPGDTIELAAGRYELTAPLRPKTGMTLRGAGMNKTILTHIPAWKPSVKTLPDPETQVAKMDLRGYLVHLENKAENISISHLTLLGPQMHGAIYGSGNVGLKLHHLRVQDFLASGIRSHGMKQSKIHNCEFIDAGGRWKRGGIPGDEGGISGGAIFGVWTKDTEIYNNRFTRTQMGKRDGHYGIKGRQFKNCRIHHNTIAVNFSIELPFENDENVEIDHNVCHGTLSLPKHKGGMKIPEGQHSFHVHHNWITKSYAIEFSRNGVEVDHNLFDFSKEDDVGNLVSEFSRVLSPGPAVFHNNLIRNPGRGLFWTNGGYNNLHFHHNHVKAATPTRPDGLFGFNAKVMDFKTIRIEHNIIEVSADNPRPLMRNAASYGAHIFNNTLTNITDKDQFDNPQADAQAGLQAPLKFRCGAYGETLVEGWKTTTHGKEPPVTVKGPAKWVQCVAFSPDGKRVVAGNDEGRLWVVEAATGKSVLECKGVVSAPTAVAWSWDGRSFAVGGWNGVVTIREAKTGKVQARWRGHTENITSIVFSADGHYLATGSGDDTAKVWSVKGGEPLLTLEQGDEYDVTGVAFSPDGHQLLTGDGENRVKLWDTRTGEESRVLGMHTEAVSAVDWSADGQWLVSGAWDDLLKIWNTKTEQAQVLRGHTDDITALAICAKGGRLVSASDDRTVRVWNLPTGKLLQTFEGHAASVISVAISPDGRRAVSGSKGELKFWELK